MKHVRSLFVAVICSTVGLTSAAQQSSALPAAAGGEVGATPTPTPGGGFGGGEVLRKPEERGEAEQKMAPGARGWPTPTLSYVTVSGKTEPAAYAGLVTSPVSAALAEQLKLPKGIGLMVDFVEPKSPAEAADVKPYDILYKLDDQLLVNAHQFTVLVRTHKAGDEVTFTVIHRGDTGPRKIKLVERDLMALDAQNPWGLPPVPTDTSYGYSSVLYRPLGLPMLAPDTKGPQPVAPGAGTPPIVFGSNRETRLSDEKGALLVQPDFGGRRLIVTDKEGKWLSAYQLNDADPDMRILPADVRSRYEKLLQLQEKLTDPLKPGAPSVTPSPGLPGFGGERNEIQAPVAEPPATPQTERR